MAYNTQEWSKNCKVVVYCPIGRALEMAKFSIQNMIETTGMNPTDFELVFLCWKTSEPVYSWLKSNNFKYVDLEYEEGKGFLWNLYQKGWNAGYDISFQHANYACALGTDHAFFDGWLANLMKHAKPNRLVNCKLIEPGVVQTIHQTYNPGRPTKDEFNMTGWREFAQKLHDENVGKLATNEREYGRRFDGSPFIMPKDVWQRFGPMSPTTVAFSPDPMGIYCYNITGDTDFTNRARVGGVEVVKALDSCVFHYGAGESAESSKSGIYT